MKRHILSTLLFGLLLVTTLSSNAQTTIQKDGTNWQLLVDNKPFPIKGITFGPKPEAETIGSYLSDLKYLGVNTIRTWGCGDETQLLLDSADAYGIKVMVGVWLRHGRSGMEGDDNFNYVADKEGKEAMFNDALNNIKRFKDHPALLLWGLGNEVVLNMATDREKKKYAQFLETLCQAVKEEDPNHPIASVSAWNLAWYWWKEYVPTLDIYAINAYGPGVASIPRMLKEHGVDKPYIITEFGATGEWDVQPDENGLKIEPTDEAKYEIISKGYKEWIAPEPTCLGVYVFHYGKAYTHGSVWLSTFLGDKKRPQYWATREAYTGLSPENHVPKITKMVIPMATAKFNEWIDVELETSDVENDISKITFHYNQRSGSRARADQIVPLEFRKTESSNYKIKLPNVKGVIKVYAFVEDEAQNLGIAQRSVIVENASLPKGYIPGAHIELPFTIYDESDNLPYLPTAYMGDFDGLTVNAECKKMPKFGKECLEINYTNEGGWYGLALVDPPNDWGDKAGGYDWSGATKLTFWARASAQVEGSVGFGMIGDDKKYHDSAKKSLDLEFPAYWKQYQIDLNGLDLSCIKTGLIFYLGGIGEPYSVWIDGVVVE